jgi:alpha-maltose-1-phosphate synthase
MRIVHVAPTAFGAGGLYGGGERYPLELCRALARLRDVELLTFGPRAGVSRLDGLTVRTFRPALLWHRHPAHPIAPQFVGALFGARVIHTHHFRSASSRIAALAARTLGIPAFVTDHGLRGGNWGGRLPRLYDATLAVSEWSARELGSDPSRTRVIYGGADPKRFIPGDERREGVLFVGRITPHKGLDILVRALPEHASLRVVGTPGHDPQPPERDYPQLVRTLAARRAVDFLGRLSDDHLAALYRGAQVVVLPSVHRTCYGRYVPVSELLGLAAIEAMASGTPVVASRIGGLPEVVSDGETGFLVEPGNVADLRGRIAEVLADRRLADRLGRAAREMVLDRFTWDRVAERCMRAYADLGRIGYESW